jgi:hypothetical protein
MSSAKRKRMFGFDSAAAAVSGSRRNIEKSGNLIVRLLRADGRDLDHFPKILRRREFLPVKEVAAAETRDLPSFRESGRHLAFILPAPPYRGAGLRPLV